MPTSWRTLAGSGRPLVASTRFATSRRAVAISSWSPSVPTAARTSSAATPRWRSSAESARRARPRPWCLVSTHARAKAASSISRTSANRPRTASATSSGTRRRRSAAASCARVRGPAPSSRRQICRAASSGSTPPSPASGVSARPARLVPARPRCGLGAPAASLPATTGGAGHVDQAGVRRARGAGRHRIGDHAQVPALGRPATGRWVRVQPRAHAELLLDLLLDLVGQVGVVAQEGAGVLLALSQLVALVGVPGAGLAHDPLLDPQVDQAAFPADPDPEQNVELGSPEWRRTLVLDDLDPGTAADRVGAVLEGLDPAYIQPDRGVELERPPAGGGLRRPEHHADLFPQLVDEDRGGLRLVERAGELAQGLGHEPGLQADVAVPHLALDLGPGHQRGDRVDDDHVDRAGADQHVGDFQRLLARVGLGDEQRVGVYAKLLGVVRIERVLGVDESGDPARLLHAGGRMQRHGGVMRWNALTSRQIGVAGVIYLDATHRHGGDRLDSRYVPECRPTCAQRYKPGGLPRQPEHWQVCLEAQPVPSANDTPFQHRWTLTEGGLNAEAEQQFAHVTGQPPAHNAELTPGGAGPAAGTR